MKEEELIAELYSAVDDKEKFNTILTENNISPKEALYISVATRTNTEEESITVANSLFQFTNLDINSQSNERGWTALHKACSDMRWPKMIRLLIERNADVNITDHFKTSPLSIAVSSSAVDDETLKLIIKTSLSQDPTQEEAKLVLKETIKKYVSTFQEANTALRNIPDHDYNSGNVESTPTYRYFSSKASFAEKLRSNIQLFLKNGLDVNARYDKGKTLLHIAVENYFYELASSLIEYGINEQIEDDNGQTAKDYTEDENYHNQQIIELFHLPSGKKPVSSTIASPKAENQSFTEENPQTELENAAGLDLQNEQLYSLEELKKINQLFPKVSKIPDKWQEASEKYSGLDIKKFKETFKQVNGIPSDQLNNIKDLVANIAVKIGLYMHYKEKRYEEAFKYFQKALNLKEKSPLDSVRILTYLGDLYETKGECNESLNYYNTAIKKIPDSNVNYDNRLDIVSLHERLASTYENLYQMNSDEDEAVVLLTDAIKHIGISLERCKELEQQSSLQEHQEEKLTIYAKIYNTAAGIYETKGEPRKALDYYEKTLDIRKKIYNEEHPSIAEIYNNIGLFYHSQALILREVFATKNNKDINSRISKIKFLCNKLKIDNIKDSDIPNKFEEAARENLYKASEILEKFGGDIYGNLQYNLGLVHKALGKIEEAKQNFEKAAVTLKKLHPNGHDNIVKVLNSLALIYKQSEDLEQAFNCYTEAKEIAKNIYGSADNYIIATLEDNIEILRKSMPSKVKSAKNVYHAGKEIPKQALEEEQKKEDDSLNSKMSEEDEYDRTPLHLAIKKDAAEAVEAFWNAGSDFTKPITNKGDTAIHLAAKYNSINTLEFLYLCQQYDFNQGDKNGNTPLHYAAYAGSVEAATALLSYGVDALIPNKKDQRTPLEAAMKKNSDLIKVVGEKEASSRKTQVAAKLIDYDYSEFLNRGGNNFCGTKGIALPAPGGFINLSSTNHMLKDYYNKAQIGSYFDAAVGKFIYRVCEFLSSKDNNAILPHGKKDHIPLITKIAKSGNVDLLQKFIDQLPEFEETLDEEQQKELFYTVRDDEDLLALLEPIYNFENKKVTWEQSPKFVINAIEEDLNHFKEAAENPDKLTEFMKKFIEDTKEEYEAHSQKISMAPNYNISTNEDVYTLLLRGAISFKREDIVREILKENHSNILTHPDATSYSPLSSTLYSGNQNILDMVKNYIELYKRDNNFKKTECEEDDKANILTIMRYPQFEDFTREKYQEILEPLYIDISPFTDLLDSFEDY